MRSSLILLVATVALMAAGPWTAGAAENAASPTPAAHDPANREMSLPYGTADGQVSFINAKNRPDVEELYPLGPQAFRVAGDEVWVADSVAGRILRVAPDGKVTSISLAPMKDGVLEDLALDLDPQGAVRSLYVLRGDTEEVVHLDPSGKVIATLGGSGDEPGKFHQAVRIEVGPTGHLYVADRTRQTLAVFTPEGKLLREMHWEWSGMCVSPEGNLCFLKWNEESEETHLMTETPDGKPVNDLVLEIGEHSNPTLWFVDGKGEAVLSYIPAEGFQGKFKIARCGPDGKPVTVGDLTPPVVMNRFLDRSGTGQLFLGAADFNEAPTGAFKVGPFKLE